MNIILSRLIPLWVPFLFLAPAHAAFNPGVVAADAKWVVFADLNGLRNSTLGRELIATAQKNMPPVPTPSGFFDFEKLLATIGNVTAYGANFTSKAQLIDGALVVEGTGDLRKIAEGWAAGTSLARPEFVVEATDMPFPAYVFGKELILGFPPEPIILLGKSKAHLVNARAVFRGDAASLAQASSSPLAKLLAKAGSAYWIGASVVPPDNTFAPDAPHARILQLVESGLISIGEDGQRTNFQAELNAKSGAMAEKLLKIVQGMTAMLSLTESNDRQLAEFLQSAIIERNDRTVSVEVGYSSDRIVRMIQSAQQHAVAQAQQPTTRNRPVASVARNYGTVVAEWKLDQAPAGASRGPETMTDHSIPNVRLVTGSTITLSALVRSARGSGTAFVDRVDIFPMEAAAPGLRFEAENMRLIRFITRNASYASGGKLIGSMGQIAAAQFEFPGVEGEYIIHVHYLEESAGTTTLAVSVKVPAVTP